MFTASILARVRASEWSERSKLPLRMVAKQAPVRRDGLNRLESLQEAGLFSCRTDCISSLIGCLCASARYPGYPGKRVLARRTVVAFPARSSARSLVGPCADEHSALAERVPLLPSSAWHGMHGAVSISSRAANRQYPAPAGLRCSAECRRAQSSSSSIPNARRVLMFAFFLFPALCRPASQHSQSERESQHTASQHTQQYTPAREHTSENTPVHTRRLLVRLALSPCADSSAREPPASERTASKPPAILRVG